MLQPEFPDIFIPQAKPLSSGEILGCTSPKISDRDALMYVRTFLEISVKMIGKLWNGCENIHNNFLIIEFS